MTKRITDRGMMIRTLFLAEGARRAAARTRRCAPARGTGRFPSTRKAGRHEGGDELQYGTPDRPRPPGGQVSGLTVRKTPCPTCPYRRDVPSGIWDASEYDKLPAYNEDIMGQALAGATGLFHCHQRTGELCAGWAGSHDLTQLLAVRLHFGMLDPAVLDYVSPVPLFGSGREAAEHGKRDLADPGPEARQKIDRLRAMKARRSA